MANNGTNATLLFMVQLFFAGIIGIEIFALANRGGGPLLSHLFLTGATFCILLGTVLFKKRIKFHSKIGLLGLPGVAYFIFLGLFIISLIFSKTPGFGLSELLLFANSGLLLLVFSTIEITEKQLRRFIIALIALAVIDTLIGFFIYTRNALPRLAGTFLDLKEPYTAFGNDFANFLLLILPLSISEFFKKQSRLITSILTGAATAILLSGFLLTFSRAAWLSAVFVLLLFIAWLVWGKIAHRRRSDVPVHRCDDQRHYDNPWHIFIKTAGCLVLTVLLTAGLQSARSKTFETTSLLKKLTFQADESTASISERTAFWKGAVRLIQDEPLTGFGVLGFRYFYPRYQEAFGVNWDHPHNVILKIGVENGLPAAVAFIVFLITAGIVIVRFLWQHPFHPVLIFSLGALAALSHNLLDFNFIVANYTLFAVFLGISLSYTPYISPPPRNFSPLAPRPSPLGQFAAALVLSGVLVFLALHEGFYNVDFKKGRAALTAGNTDTAVEHLQRADNLFFKRDLSHYLVLAYEKKYQETKDQKWRVQEKELLIQQTVLQQDATFSARLGDILQEEKKYKTAEEWFQKAIHQDPRNRLRYYYQLVSVQKVQGKTIDPSMRQQILDLLREYNMVLAENRHMTILTDNPASAAELYEFFGMKKEQEELETLWFMELLKFTKKYGTPARPVSYQL